MLERILRSPLYTMITWCLLIIISIMYAADKLTIHVLPWILLLNLAIQMTWNLSRSIYNKNNPEHPIANNRWLPWHFNEQDEGKRWITHKACRNVYVFFSFALPVAFLLTLLFPLTRMLVVIVLGSLGLGQVLVYWLTINKYHVK
ncbi:hypothetical protein [Paenibacillus sp. sgz500958]|uniref:hypothetical protein n=1 Tax=Paenibacillus sp. sgz500958 TaxID=3242475 RepID=UPI0036D23493